jgi:integrase
MGLVARNVCELVDPPRKAKSKMQVFTPEEVGRLLEATQGNDYAALVTLAVTTGARLGELLALCWSATDLEHGTITIRAGRAEVVGGYADTEPKTDAANRTIALTSIAMTALKEHRTQQLERRNWLGEAWHEREYVFPNKIGDQLGHATVERAFAKLVAREELPRLRFHDLRHTAATLLLLSGVPVAEVSRILGHANPSITYKLYAHTIPSAQQQAVAAMEAITARR